jgi:hypothetical protein
VVLVDDFVTDITQANLDKWLLKYGGMFRDPEVRRKLTMDYYFEKFKQKANEFRIT